MEAQRSEDDLGKDNYHCSSLLYGYDEQYAYTWVYCSGYEGTGSGAEPGTGFSVPTRLEYRQADGQVTGFKQPVDGAGYGNSLRKLFPKKIYDMTPPANDQLNQLVAETKAKA